MEISYDEIDTNLWVRDRRIQGDKKAEPANL